MIGSGGVDSGEVVVVMGEQVWCGSRQQKWLRGVVSRVIFERTVP